MGVQSGQLSGYSSQISFEDQLFNLYIWKIKKNDSSLAVNKIKTKHNCSR